ncbi:MAG: hypothetical protein CVU88_03730 [Firmicutes bacterium HGW-Firmicutes-13]|nr:MAG: hypothetical protein CVU88_03730 [Firmicutes bacterium HGW-Firmicutes-13]
MQQLQDRKAKIINSTADEQIISERKVNDHLEVEYLVHYELLIQHKDTLYTEEIIQKRKSLFHNEELVDDYNIAGEGNFKPELNYRTGQNMGQDYTGTLTVNALNETRNLYNREAVIQYAEKWWDSDNPAYRAFELNCTNYVSQCVRAGGAPMRGFPNRGVGWWYANNNWSFSWAVAHSLQWYLKSSKTGLRAEEVPSADQLIPGDVICYDFNADGRWQHNTVIVAKDGDNMPLVNAHTFNSRMRYWAYEDSIAWTPEIKYTFFHIIG